MKHFQTSGTFCSYHLPPRTLGSGILDILCQLAFQLGTAAGALRYSSSLSCDRDNLARPRQRLRLNRSTHLKGEYVSTFIAGMNIADMPRSGGITRGDRCLIIGQRGLRNRRISGGKGVLRFKAPNYQRPYKSR